MSYYYLDLRYAIILVINMLKPADDTSEWDPFGIIVDPTPTKFCLVLGLSLLFPFVSIRISLNYSPSYDILVRATNFSAMIVISLLASLLLPRLYFWYSYPAIILLTSCVSALIRNVLLSVQPPILSVANIPGFDIHITVSASSATDEETEIIEEEQDHHQLAVVIIPDLEEDFDGAQLV
ncbi:hypothetical protein ABFS83_05G123900 [Erythranthe nasuta]